ncbi:MAG: SPOR domain-containing protein [Glaciecola sp.]
MVSQLHERLEHLVNYSSQLIFVSGDTIAQQHRNLESFLAQQDEQSEIAYVQLEEGMEDADLRRNVCRQLVDTSVNTYVRPFNELLHSLNQYDGPVLICITQAQLMSDAILHELWDLVLQSRFANNKAHLNVILFAETVWSETAQQYLPARNSSQPILLANESFSSLDDHQGSELDRLIAAKRAAFSERMNSRENGLHLPVNVLRSPWFIGVMVLMFCLLFTSLVAMQYPEQVQRFAQIFKTLDAPAVIAASEPDVNSLQDIQALADVSGVNTQVLLTETTPIISSSTVVEESPLIDNVPGLVMSWSESQTQLHVAKQTLATQMLVAQPSSALSQAKPTSSAAIIDTQIMIDASKIFSISDTHFAIQLAGMSSAETLNDFIIANALEDQSWLYETQRYGGSWYVVLLNNDYSSIQEARRAVNSLPPEVQALSPFIKSISAIKNEILIADD